MGGVRKKVRYGFQNRKEGSSQGFLRHLTLYLTNPIEKNRKINSAETQDRFYFSISAETQIIVWGSVSAETLQ